MDDLHHQLKIEKNPLEFDSELDESPDAWQNLSKLLWSEDLGKRSNESAAPGHRFSKYGEDGSGLKRDSKTLPDIFKQQYSLLSGEDSKVSSSANSDAKQTPSDEPTETTLHEAQGTMRHKEWKSGPRKGEKEDVFEDGTVVHYTPDGKGGERVEQTRPDGRKYIDHARPDGKGGAIIEHTEPDPRHNYTSYHASDGSLKVDWRDGRHLERYTDKNGTVHTSMTGRKPDENFTATESKNLTRVTYGDGSSYEERDGKLTRGTNSWRNISTFWRLNAAFWMSMSQAADDVRFNRIDR